MKRPHSEVTRKYLGVSGDIKKDLTPKQLAAVGSISFAYNKVEDRIDKLVAVVTGLSGAVGFQVISRINGIDNKIQIITHGGREIGLNQEDQRQLEETLGEGVFMKLKRFRDAVIHARLVNAAIGIGVTVEKKAKLNDVLLSQAALDALYEHLIALENELERATKVMIVTGEIKRRAADDPSRASYEEGRAKYSAQFRAYRARRPSLPPIPEFPSEQEFREADDQWKQALQAELTGFLKAGGITLPQRAEWRPRSKLMEPPYPPDEQKK